MTRMNVYHSPGDHFIIPDRVFVKKKKIKCDEQKRKPTPGGTVRNKKQNILRNVTTKPIIIKIMY